VKRRILHRAAERIAAGSSTVYRHRTDALAAWVAAGRRDDLTGWRGALGPLLRLAVLAAGAYILWMILARATWLMWLLTALWLRVAWRAAPTAPQTADAQAAETPASTGPGPVLALLRQVLGDRPAVHLSEVLTHLQAQGQWEGHTVADLRAHFEAFSIPVDPKVKVGGSPTRGVRRRDLDAHFPGWDTPPVSQQVDAA
jgi:hypothetical protein